METAGEGGWGTGVGSPAPCLHRLQTTHPWGQIHKKCFTEDPRGSQRGRKLASSSPLSQTLSPAWVHTVAHNQRGSSIPTTSTPVY